jgi:signal transduction histidine kinase
MPPLPSTATAAPTATAKGRQNTWPSRTSPTWTGQPSGLFDSELDAPFSNPAGEASAPAERRWSGWRLRLLVGCALLGVVLWLGLVRTLVTTPHVDAVWRATGNTPATIELVSSRAPKLAAHAGKVLVGIVGGAASVALTDASALQHSPRWQVRDAARQQMQSVNEQLAAVLAQARVKLFFADGAQAEVSPQPRGVAGLPLTFWLLSAFGLALYAVGLVVALGQLSARHVLYGVMALCQACNLLFIAIESVFDLGMAAPFARLDMPVRMALDLITAAALVSAACLHPRRLPGSGWLALACWALALGLVGAYAAGGLAQVWWWTQGTVIVLLLIAIALLSWSYRIEPHPFAIVMRRFSVVTAVTWSLLTAALAAADGVPGTPPNVAGVGSLVWYVFLGALLLLVPFLARSQIVMREFALLAAVTTVATSLDLLFFAGLSLERFSSLALSLGMSLAVYTAARHWILNQARVSSTLTTERMFEQLYRIAREVEAQPERTPALLSQLLSELFEPLDITVVERRAGQSRLADDGSSLLVPVPNLSGDASAPRSALMVRFAQRGRRLFTSEDARLASRIVEQLKRAVHFDKAVEQGRKEERLRLAQDLHDDIGARLLTLMYKAQSPEMEDYVRHTLQDLKTLTRGLAASNHRLSHAAAEWKTDLAHRLSAAHVELKWSFVFDDDILLTVVHWSALTRVLRELVSNAIAHSQAQQLEVDFRLENDRIELTITDNGIGRNPRAWSHGLGLGGVRKRVKQLGGDVEWREAETRGISCRVTIRELSARW